MKDDKGHNLRGVNNMTKSGVKKIEQKKCSNWVANFLKNPFINDKCP